MLNREGSATIPALADEAELNVETVRHHLQALTAEGLVERQGTRRSGPGRPEVVYSLTRAAETLFPRREGQILRELVVHLMSTGNEALLQEFFDSYIAERRGDEDPVPRGAALCAGASRRPPDAAELHPRGGCVLHVPRRQSPPRGAGRAILGRPTAGISQIPT
jgi:DNA-binding HxlR family transcriptional regulator